ncbi:hypothetical protein [Siccirubricoccus phaeus]|uniref:hypothetical protein n=1 Tax=Siccirubricoccus phaeus TaxID=2595053 RepID=UPI0011F3ED26|nr:hypothetical protein [Siccirubricoccus phaeus]
MALDERLNLPVSLAMLRALDDWRRRQVEIPTRAEAARKLLAKALKAEGLNPEGKPPPKRSE